MWLSPSSHCIMQKSFSHWPMIWEHQFCSISLFCVPSHFLFCSDTSFSCSLKIFRIIVSFPTISLPSHVSLRSWVSPAVLLWNFWPLFCISIIYLALWSHSYNSSYFSLWSLCNLFFFWTIRSLYRSLTWYFICSWCLPLILLAYHFDSAHISDHSCPPCTNLVPSLLPIWSHQVPIL